MMDNEARNGIEGCTDKEKIEMFDNMMYLIKSGGAVLSYVSFYHQADHIDLGYNSSGWFSQGTDSNNLKEILKCAAAKCAR